MLGFSHDLGFREQAKHTFLGAYPRLGVIKGLNLGSY